jgi:hypothetical protein
MVQGVLVNIPCNFEETISLDRNVTRSCSRDATVNGPNVHAVNIREFSTAKSNLVHDQLMVGQS